MQFTDDPEFAELEAAYAVYLDAWGAWMVGHHAGGTPAREGALAEGLVTAHREVGARLDAHAWHDVAPADRAALENIRSALADLDAWTDSLDGHLLPGGGNGDGPTGHEPPEVAELRRRTFEAWGTAMAGIEVGGARLDRLTAIQELAREEDPDARRRLFVAMDPGWRAVNSDDGPASPYRQLLQASSARWAREGSPVEANAAALGMAPGDVEPTMRRMLEGFRRVALGSGLVEPWDYRFAVGGLARRLDPLIPRDRLRPINDAHLAAIGADPAELRIRYDIFPRPDRPLIPTAFTVMERIAHPGADGRWIPARSWVFATYAEGGHGNLEELLHESGHALHDAALRARPAHQSLPPDQTAFVEAVADVVGWTTHEPAFLHRHLGAEVTLRESVIARFGGVALDAAWTLFEIELHRHPDRSPNDAWAEIAERDLGVRGRPEWSWWAGRGQLIDGPGYLANYALGAVMVAAVRARIRELRGDWSAGDPGWYAFVSEHLLQYAGARTPRDVLEAFLGGPLTADALLAEIERAS
jgi:hypothetical protein